MVENLFVSPFIVLSVWYTFDAFRGFRNDCINISVDGGFSWKMDGLLHCV